MPAPSKSAICSVLIPAFNEEAVIGRTLSHLLADSQPGELDLIILPNGCKDRTAEIARKRAPEARIISLEQGSKTSALNRGLDAALVTPILFLDADIIISIHDVRAMVKAARQTDVFLVHGRACFQTGQASPFVRAFYRAWQFNSYFDQAKLGGCFMLTDVGLKTLGRFPHVKNDDEYVRRLLGHQKIHLSQVRYQIDVPRSVNSLIQVRSRIYDGNRSLEQNIIPIGSWQRLANAVRFVFRLMVRPTTWPGAVVFIYVALYAQWISRARPQRWARDLTSRTMTGHAQHKVGS